MESVKTILAIDDNRDILYTLEQIFNFQDGDLCLQMVMKRRIS